MDVLKEWIMPIFNGKMPKGSKSKRHVQINQRFPPLNNYQRLYEADFRVTSRQVEQTVYLAKDIDVEKDIKDC